MRVITLAVVFATLTTPTFADAVTYKGTLDGKDILVELIEAEDGPVGGRFTYLAEGGDIPLDPAASPEGMIYLAEQAPCGETDCVPDDDNKVDMPPYAATWVLTIEDGGATLVGVRHLDGDKRKTPNVEVTEIGRRPLGSDEPTPFGLHDRSAILGFDRTQELTAAAAPYDYALLNYAYDAGASQTSADGSEYFYATDPRTKFPFPRIASLSDGSDTITINDKLAELHGRMSLSALDCLAFRYAAWGQSNNFHGWGGHLGEYNNEAVEVTYLSPRLVSWVESGSLYCTGAHPYNHYDSYTYDVETGEPVDERAILGAWVPREYGAAPDQVAATEDAEANPDAYVWGPSPELIAYVEANLPGDVFDAELKEDCASPQALADQLTIRFVGVDEVMFTLSGFPHVIGVCNGDLFSRPIAELGAFFAPAASRYFPALAE